MISIIVPVYNIEKHLEKCILSIVQQTYPHFELLLIDDGSTDSSLKICRQWAEKDSRIIVRSKPNGGVGSARNLGLDLAKGDYIFFVDGDDWIRQDCLELMIEKMSPETDLVSCDYQEVYEEEPPELRSFEHKHQEGVILQRDAIRDFYELQLYTKVIWGKLYKKEFWESLRFNTMVYTEDTYAIFQILEKIQTIYSIDQPLYFYLQRSSSASQTRGIREYEDLLETLFYTYQRAVDNYPMYRTLPAMEYNGHAYVLLKKYQRLKQRANAMDLISRMQFVYKTSGIENPDFSQKLLVLPRSLIYCLIAVKSYIKKEEK